MQLAGYLQDPLVEDRVLSECIFPVCVLESFEVVPLCVFLCRYLQRARPTSGCAGVGDRCCTKRAASLRSLPPQQPEAFPAVFEQKHRKFPPDSQTSFLHTLLALPLLLLPLEGLNLMSGLLVFSFSSICKPPACKRRASTSPCGRLER